MSRVALASGPGETRRTSGLAIEIRKERRSGRRTGKGNESVIATAIGPGATGIATVTGTATASLPTFAEKLRVHARPAFAAMMTVA